MSTEEATRIKKLVEAEGGTAIIQQHSLLWDNEDSGPASTNKVIMPNDVIVTVDHNRVIMTSQLELGVTHTQFGLDTGGDTVAIARGKKLLREARCRLHNVHIMGWGTLNPNPAPGIYDWSTLDRRMAMVRSIPGSVPVLTLCGCPDWMKGGTPGETDWSKLEVAPVPEHYTDFAALAATIARRYPDVRQFQVWNEMKGLWNAKENN